MKNKPTIISVSTASLFKILILAAAVYLAYLISDIVALLFAALVFASAIDPWVDWLAKRGLPRGVGILIIYLLLLSLASLAVYLIIPPIINEAKELGNNLPAYTDSISAFFFNFKTYAAEHSWAAAAQTSLDNLVASLQIAASGVINAVSAIFGGIFSFFLLLVITFYMTAEENSLKKAVINIMPARQQTRAITLVNRIQQKIGSWFRGQLLLCLIVFIMTYVSLLVLGVKYALVLAIIAGLTEAVPYLGPMLAAVPAVFLSFVQSPPLALFVLIIYIVIQVTENNILVPKIMQRAVGLDPIISIAALMVGFKLGGILGAVLAIPLATALSVIIKDFYLNYRQTND